MLTIVLIFSLLILLLLNFAALRRRLFLYPKSENEKLSPFEPKAASLFAPTEEEIRLFEKAEHEKLLAERREELRQNLISRANESDFSVLIEAKVSGDADIYKKILDLLAERIKLERTNFEKLIAFVSENDLPTDDDFAKNALEHWKANPSSSFLPKVLHVSALSRSAENYLNAVETIFEFWQQKILEKVSANQLIALFESHYQLLPTDEKASGAGFLLKEKLASVRREVLGK